MSFDNLTISALTIVVVMIFVIVLIARNTTATERKMREMARHMMLVQANEKAHELCKKIKEISPDLCAGLDFTMKENGEDVEIDEWYSKHPRP